MTALLIALAVVLIALNGLFVAAEFAIVRSRIARLELEESPGAVRAVAQSRDLDTYLAACQLGITLASIGLGFVGEPAIGGIFERLVEDSGASRVLAVVAGTAIAYSLVTVFHVVLGEQAPKLTAIGRPERTVILVSRPMAIFIAMFRPLVRALSAATNGVLSIFRVAPPAEVEPTSREDYRLLIEESVEHGELPRDAADMLSGALDLAEREAREVMTPRPDIVSAGGDATVREVAEISATSGHSRIPLLDGESILGIVHVSDLAGRAVDQPDAAAADLRRDAWVVPETKRLDHLLRELRGRHSTMALVADEYGDVAGLVTLEDIIEEIVGEIYDETDPEGSTLQHGPNGSWLTDGRVALNDLVDAGLQVDTADRRYTTVGGLILDNLGRQARRGDRVVDGPYEWIVEEVRGTRIGRVRVRRAEAADAAAAPPSAA